MSEPTSPEPLTGAAPLPTEADAWGDPEKAMRDDDAGSNPARELFEAIRSARRKNMPGYLQVEIISRALATTEALAYERGLREGLKRAAQHTVGRAWALEDMRRRPSLHNILTKLVADFRSDDIRKRPMWDEPTPDEEKGRG